MALFGVKGQPGRETGLQERGVKNATPLRYNALAPGASFFFDQLTVR